MARPIQVRNPHGELVESPEVSASDAKNVGRVLDYVAKAGGVTITRRRAPLAVVIPVETYARLLAAEEGTLDTLSAEFDAVLERMQRPEIAAAMERAFRLSRERLGAAAVAQAKGLEQPVRRRAAAKHVRAKRSRAK